MFREKSDKDKNNFEKLNSVIAQEGGKLGYFAKDKPDTEFTKDALQAIQKADPSPVRL